jgi:hypothetical protein
MTDYLTHNRMFQGSTERQLNSNQLSQRQKQTLQMALWAGKILDSEDPILASKLKRLLLRAFAIYRRRKHLKTEKLHQYCCDLRHRMQQCLISQPNPLPRFWLRQHYAQFPYYVFLLLNELDEFSNSSSSNKWDVKQRTTNPRIYVRKARFLWFDPYKSWVALVRLFLAIATQNLTIVRLKQKLGSISLVPIQISNKPVIVRGIRLHYHDLYHLEVAQFERIQMGRHHVSGIHGINQSIFHRSPIVEEYDSFLDEARIAIHECLTRPSPFSQLKAFCWMILLLLQGINPVAVFVRHVRSLRRFLETSLYLNPNRLP